MKVETCSDIELLSLRMADAGFPRQANISIRIESMALLGEISKRQRQLYPNQPYGHFNAEMTSISYKTMEGYTFTIVRPWEFKPEKDE